MTYRFEHRSEPLLTTPAFVRRVIISFSFGIAIVLVSLAIRMAGYHIFEYLPLQKGSNYSRSISL
jgi:hypothetical protein